MNLDRYIRNIPDFPKPGIQFKDITPLLGDPLALRKTIEAVTEQYRGVDFDSVVGIESRGFIFGMGISMLLNKGFIPIRKPGKLPADVYKETYELEYGTDSLEIHKDAISPGQNVLLVDDLLATGGTMQASTRLIEKCGGKVVGCAFIIELESLNGREKLIPHNVTSLLKY